MSRGLELGLARENAPAGQLECAGVLGHINSHKKTKEFLIAKAL